MATTEKKYLDLLGLTHYDEKIKAYIKANGSDVTDKLVALIGAAEKGADEKTILARIAELEAAVGDVSELGDEVANLVKAILGEAARAKAVEEANASAIAAEKSRAEGIEGGLETRLSNVEADYLKASDKTELSTAIGAEKTRAEGKEAELKKAIEDEATARANKIGVIGDKTVKTYVDDAINSVNSAASTLGDRVSANETAIALLNNADANVEGSVAHAVKVEETRATGAENALSGRLDKVEAFFATEDGKTLDAALDTLVEIQDYIGTHGEAAAAMASDIAGNKKAIADEITLARSEESKLSTAINTEKSRAEGAEGTLAGRLDVIEGEGAGSIKAAVAAEATRAASKEAEIEAKVDAFTTITNTEIDNLFA